MRFPCITLCFLALVSISFGAVLPELSQNEFVLNLLRPQRVPLSNRVKIGNPGTRDVVTEGSIISNLDNFNEDDNRTFVQRFFTNYEHYDSAVGGPMFIFLGGELTVPRNFIEEGTFYEMAREQGAALFALEHRFYGSSLIDGGASLENLEYLTVEQALADIRHFIDAVLFLLPEFADDPIILAGTSYSGSLATWFRAEYPDYSVGAWASSAPLLAVVSNQQYLEVAGEIFRDIGGEACYNRIDNAFDEIDELLASNETELLDDLFNTCRPMITMTTLDRQMILSNLVRRFASAVEYFFADTIVSYCDTILEADNDLQGLSDLVRSDFCNDVSYEGIVEILSSDGVGDPFMKQVRSYEYQLCTELGWFESSDSDDQPFGSGFPADFQYQLCEDVFGLDRTEVDAGINAFNERYGGLTPNVENVVSTVGSMDPWGPIAAQGDLSESSPTIVIQNATTGMDIVPHYWEPNPHMDAAIEQLGQIIDQWIDDAAKKAKTTP